MAKRRNRNACIERLQRYLVGLEKKMEAQRCHGHRVSRICQAAGGFIAILHLYFPQKVGTFDIQFL